MRQDTAQTTNRTGTMQASARRSSFGTRRPAVDHPVDCAGPTFWSRLMHLDDGTLVRLVFRVMLVAVAAVLVLDLSYIRSVEGEASDLSAANPVFPNMAPLPIDARPLGPHGDQPFKTSLPAGALKEPVRFELKADGVLSAVGAIDLGAFDRFAEEIAARGEYVELVDLNSPGGSVEDAMQIADLIREHDFKTRVSDGALCASSCPLILAGGAQRFAAPNALIGIHQIFSLGDINASPEAAMAQTQTTTARVARHLERMGVDPGLWFHALETPSDQLYYLSGEELSDFRLVTRDYTAAALIKGESDHLKDKRKTGNVRSANEK